MLREKKMEEKIKLIKLSKEHFPLFYKWWNDRELRKLTSETFEIIEKAKIDKILKKHLANENGCDFIITVSEKPIGHILIQRKNHKKYYEIYIAIGEKEFWSKGYGTEAMKQATTWFFQNFPKEKCLELEVNANNPRAKKCYEKSGSKVIRLKPTKKYSDEFLMRKYRK